MHRLDCCQALPVGDASGCSGPRTSTTPLSEPAVWPPWKLLDRPGSTKPLKSDAPRALLTAANLVTHPQQVVSFVAAKGIGADGSA
jgi:hypothetical protein